jgi:DNA polymerase III subunit alpha, Gram-positive type
MNLNDVLQKLEISSLDRVYFNNAQLLNIKMFRESKKVVIEMSVKQALPFPLFNNLTQSIQEYIGLSLELIIHAQECDLTHKDLQLYINHCIDINRLSELNHNRLSLLEDSILYFIVEPNDLNDKVTSHVNQLEIELQKYGIKYPCKTRIKKDEPVEIESIPQMISTEPEFNKTQLKNKRTKKEDSLLITLKDCVLGQRGIKVRGKIFQIDSQWIKNNTTLRQTVYFYDETDALSFSQFLDEKSQIEKFGLLNKGDCIEVYGDIIYDNFSKDIQIQVRDVKLVADWMQRRDEANDKRTELHLHTNMSEMDGVSTIDAYINLAYQWGHNAIAITDHHSVQAYPKAQRAVEGLLKKNPSRSFKMIYGIEFNMVEARYNIVSNPKNQSLHDSTYVVLDLETTGLSSEFDRIIEFAAIRVQSGMIIDRMQMFVNPHQSLSAFITEKTNIKQADVDGAESIENVIDLWLDFIKDDIILAHNANFDIGFINANLLRLNRPSLTNTVVDTLDLSKALLKDKKYYRLGVIAKHYKIPYDESGAHRADYDTEVLHQVFGKMLMSDDLGKLKTVNELNSLDQTLAFQKNMKKHINLLVKNQSGLKSLFKLVTMAHTERLTNGSTTKSENDGSISEPRICREDIINHRKDLLVGSSCFNGEIFEIAANRSKSELIEAMKFYDYIEIQPLENYRPLIENNAIVNEARLKQIVQKIITTAIETNTLLVATGDAHYLNPIDKQFRDVYIQAKGVGAGRHPLYIYNEQRRQMSISPDQHLRTTQEMLDAFSFLDKELAYRLVVTNPKLIVNQIENVKAIKSDLYTPSIEGADDNLRKIVYDNAHARYGNPLPELIHNRIEKELNSIITHGFGVIYYIAHLLVKKSIDDGYMVGSRGSVGSSLVATLANITEVNPLAPHYVCPKCHHSEFINDGSSDSGYDLPNKLCPTCDIYMDMDGHDIPFETFLGFEGDKVPDIDLNFSGDYQDKAHAYTKVLFGEDHVFRAGTISTVAQRTAYGYIKGYLEEMGLQGSYRQAMMLYLANGCEGVKKTSGQHPGGIIVIPQDNDVYDFTPVQYPANKSQSEWLTTHFEFADIHDNVLKLDILGHVDPTAMKFLEKYSDVDVRKIKMNDEDAISVFSSTKALKIRNPNYTEKTGAVGLPEFGTGFVRQILELTKPQKFSDLVRISGLSHGTDVWLNNAKSLIETGYTLNDVIGCRDDIMVYLIHKGLPAKAAFDIMESVRKGKGLKEEWKSLMASYNVPEWYIQSCLKIKYMFPKAHAIAYVLMAVRVAWFKVNKPIVYYASYFSLRATSHEYETYILGEAKVLERLKDIQRRLNDNRLKSSVTHKEEELVSSLEVVYEMMSRGYYFSPLQLNVSHATEFILDPKNPKNLIPPFTIVDGLGENVAKSIVLAREKKSFISKEDLVSRTQVNTSVIKKFDAFGLLNHLDDENQMSLF